MWSVMTKIAKMLISAFEEVSSYPFIALFSPFLERCETSKHSNSLHTLNSIAYIRIWEEIFFVVYLRASPSNLFFCKLLMWPFQVRWQTKTKVPDGRLILEKNSQKNEQDKKTPKFVLFFFVSDFIRHSTLLQALLGYSTTFP